MKNVNPFPKKNLSAYMTVMGSMILMSLLLWGIFLLVKTGTFNTSYFSNYSVELIFSVVMVMSGMMIMFIASLLNLKKMKSGWEAMAQGKKDVKIPEVWCPVLTSAKAAAEQLIENTNNQQAKA